MANIKELIQSIESPDSSFDEKLAAINQMEETLVAMREQEQEAVNDNVELIIEALRTIEAKVEAKLRIIPEKGEQGIQGQKGEQGDRGLDGAQGKDGKSGVDGKDGLDGKDGVSVQDAKIDFDGSLVITLSDGREINVGEVVPVDVAEKIRTVHNIQSGSGGDSQTVLDAIAALQATIATYGTMATQNANNVAITGGTINNTTIGATTPSTGVFTTLTGGGSSANYFQTQGSATTKAVEIKALGSDSNVAFVIDSKGTGAIDLAAGSSGVNISNGGTVTALTTTANGTVYTSLPSVAISAPTTAGGVQATASISAMFTSTATVNSGGTGYTIGDVLTLVGGTVSGGGAVGRYTVASVSSGVITAVTRTQGNYLVLPTNPVSVTGGTGTDATLNLTWLFQSASITNAGSDYVEQPTVTFSGGGGSGAAAYATVGSGTTIKSIGATLDLSVDNTSSQAFRLYNSGGTGTAYWSAASGSSSPFLYAQGGTNVTGRITSSGTGSVALYTGGGAQLQLNVAHTASAVNYVQVTGGATGSGPTISSQGSDANARLLLNAKGTSSGIDLLMNNSRQMFIGTNGSAVNYFQTGGSVAGVGLVLSAQGSDTNINAVVQPKGTGALQAQQTDSTATGGNARGANAVDWQTARDTQTKVASGQYSALVGGYGNLSSAFTSFAGGGYTNNASGYNSVVVGGTTNTSSGAYSAIVGGVSNTASKFYNFVGSGQSNTAAGYYNFIGGGFTNSGTANGAVTTQSGTMNATTAVTLSGSNANIKVGQYITGTSIADETYVAAISGTSLTLSKVASGSSTSTLSFFTPHGVVVGGGNNQATGSYSFIGGGGDAGTAAQRNTASGDYSVVVGGTSNTASGIGSFVGGGGRFGSGFSGNVSSGISSAIVGGLSNNSSGSYTFVGGGQYHTANGGNSTIVGGTYGSTRSIVGYMAFPACLAPTSGTYGTTQAALLVVGTQTTDATATVLRSDTNAASTTNQVILPNNSAYFFTGEIISGITGGGNTKGWTIEGVIKRGANAASTALVGTPTVTSTYADAGASTWVIAVTADTTNGGLAVTFTGQASTTIRTVAQIRTTEMTY